MGFFQLTAAEIAADKRLTDLKAALDASQQTCRDHRRPYGETPLEWEAEHLAFERRRDDLQESLNEAAADEAYRRCQIKNAINTQIPQDVSPSAILSVVEEALTNLSGDAVRTAALLKMLAIAFMAALADEEIQQARANIAGARYKALLKAGIPAELAGQIMVAQASQPWPTNLASAYSKKKE